jgi:hypothetical protein
MSLQTVIPCALCGEVDTHRKIHRPRGDYDSIDAGERFRIMLSLAYGSDQRGVNVKVVILPIAK